MPSRITCSVQQHLHAMYVWKQQSKIVRCSTSRLHLAALMAGTATCPHAAPAVCSIMNFGYIWKPRPSDVTHPNCKFMLLLWSAATLYIVPRNTCSLQQRKHRFCIHSQTVQCNTPTLVEYSSVLLRWQPSHACPHAVSAVKKLQTNFHISHRQTQISTWCYASIC
jgi:hypothetical protein